MLQTVTAGKINKGNEIYYEKVTLSFQAAHKIKYNDDYQQDTINNHNNYFSLIKNIARKHTNSKTATYKN